MSAVTPAIRRVVTAHDAQRKPIVAADEVLPLGALRAGQDGRVIWATGQIPTDNLDPADGAGEARGTLLAGGAVFRIVRYAAGAIGRMHRTESLDLGVIMSGSIVLELDGGAEVTLGQGDVVVQRGTAHKWVNRGTEPCAIAFVLIGAVPLPPDPAAVAS
ncbi:MAG TPA: cupin domain-containing protein [Steroidobacteraceae bacterium]|jgi:quercetin dioxygenase-like cupin family protein|nr:cupin domain-containing protein [Steroidobacteraceae bacterium]